MKDMTIKEIEELKYQAQGLIAEIIDKYESMCPMLVEDIEVEVDEDTRKTIITFKDSYVGEVNKTKVKNGK